MSSANLVSVVYVPETVYGVPDTPLSGVTAETTRFTSETLSGSPTTTESQNIRTDRMSSGQVITGLEVGGDLNIELAAGKFYEDFIEAGMMSTWTAAASLNTDVTLTPTDAVTATLTTVGDMSTIPIAVGDVLQLVPATGTPVTVTVISITSTTEAVVATTEGQAAISSVTMDVTLPAYVDIGANARSFTIAKSYLDVQHLLTTDDHSQTYPGSLVSGFSFSAAYGEIVTGSFSTMGNDYIQEPADSYEQQIVAAGGTVNPAATTQSLNASVDVPLLTADGTSATFCVENLTITLDNGLDPSNCIGEAAPQGYTLGTAAVSVEMSIYLGDESYDTFQPKKLTQEPISLTINMQNADGGYSFAFAAVQLSFPDPASDGQNEQTMLDASGTGKVGANGESALRVYKLVGEQ